jgi:hypothetical protein
VDVAERGRIAGAVGEENAVGFFASTSAAVAVELTTSTSKPAWRRRRRMLNLRPKVVGDDAVADGRQIVVGSHVAGGNVGQHPLAGFVLPLVGCGGGNLLDVVHALHRGRGLGGGDGGFRV